MHWIRNLNEVSGKLTLSEKGIKDKDFMKALKDSIIEGHHLIVSGIEE